MENWYKIAKSEYIDESEVDHSLKSGKWEPVDSSFISHIAYHPLAQVLEVRLKNNNEYTFMGVPKRIYEQFKTSPSKGSFFNNIIKKKYILK